MRGSDDSVVLHPTPSSRQDTSQVADATEECEVTDLTARCDPDHTISTHEEFSACMDSPVVSDAAPLDGMVAVRPTQRRFAEAV